jgi:hypothetical protein
MEGVEAEGPKSTQLITSFAGKRDAHLRAAMLQMVVSYVFYSALRTYSVG